MDAGTFPIILWRMMQSGVFERLPKLKLVGSEVQCGWLPYYMEKFDESVKRNRADWNLPMLPSEYFDRNVWLVYIEDELGAVNRYNIGVDKIMWGPDFPHSSSRVARRLRARPRDPRACRIHRVRDRADHVEELRRRLQHPLRRSQDHQRRRLTRTIDRRTRQETNA